MSVGLFPVENDEAQSKDATLAQDADASTNFTDITQLQDIVIDLWQNGFMGIDLPKLLGGFAIFAGFLVVRGLFTKYVLGRLHRLTDRSSSRLDDKVVDALIPPIQFIPILLGIYFSFRYVGLNDVLGDVFAQIIKTMSAYVIFWSVYRSLLPLSEGLQRLESILTPTMVMWLFKSLRIGTVLFAIAVILEIWGIQVGPLLAGLGLFGVAVALGAQDFFKNLIAGITIIAEKRFQPGEWIRVDGVVEGVVEDVGIRSTQVRRFDKAPVHVPNSQLSDTAIINFSRMTNRRIFWQIGVEYRSTTEQLKIIRDEILKYVREHDAYEKDGLPVFVRVDSFGPSSIDFMLYCFTKTTDWGEWLAIKEELTFKIKEIVEDIAGTGFAFPSQSLYIESLPTDRPENFAPPPKA